MISQLYASLGISYHPSWWILILYFLLPLPVASRNMESVYAAETFLKMLPHSNPEFWYDWMFLRFQIEEDLNWDSILESFQSPRILLNDTFDKSLQTYPERLHFSSFRRVVTFATDSLDFHSTARFLFRSNWAELHNVRTSMMMSTYFLFLNFNPDSTLTEKLSKYVLSLRAFPFWYPFKAFVQWDKELRVTTLCWHCSEEETFQSGPEPYYLKRYSISDLKNSGNYKASLIFPDYTRNLNQGTLFISYLTQSTCEKFHEIIETKRFGSKDGARYNWFVIDALATKYNFSCVIHLRHARKIAIFTGITRTFTIYLLGEPSPSINYDRMSFCYVEALPGHSWKNIFYPFTHFLWLTLLVTWIGMSIFLCSAFAGTRIEFWLWTTYDILLLQGLNLQVEKIMDHERTPNARLRVILHITLLAWLLCSTIFAAAYSSQLSSLLTQPREKEIPPETFQDLLDAKWEVGTPSFFTHLFDFSGSPAFNSLKKIMVNFTSAIGCMKHAFNNPRFACVGMAESISIDAKADLYSKGKLEEAMRIKVAPDPTFNTVGTGLVWRWWVPYRKHFAETIRHLLSGGFPAWWVDISSEHKRIWRKDTTPLKLMLSQYNGGGEKVMALEHLKGSFYLLILGLGLTVLVFLLEFISSKFC